MKISKSTVILILLVVLGAVALVISMFINKPETGKQTDTASLIESCGKVQPGMTQRQVIGIMPPSNNNSSRGTNVISTFTEEGESQLVQIIYDAKTKRVIRTICGGEQ